jgi:hypothetical protein
VDLHLFCVERRIKFIFKVKKTEGKGAMEALRGGGGGGGGGREEGGGGRGGGGWGSGRPGFCLYFNQRSPQNVKFASIKAK